MRSNRINISTTDVSRLSSNNTVLCAAAAAAPVTSSRQSMNQVVGSSHRTAVLSLLLCIMMASGRGGGGGDGVLLHLAEGVSTCTTSTNVPLTLGVSEHYATAGCQYVNPDPSTTQDLTVPLFDLIDSTSGDPYQNITIIFNGTSFGEGVRLTIKGFASRIQVGNIGGKKSYIIAVVGCTFAGVREGFTVF